MLILTKSMSKRGLFQTFEVLLPDTRLISEQQGLLNVNISFIYSLVELL